MLQRNLSSWQRPRWQQALAEAINNPSELLKLLELPQDALPISGSAARQFPLRVPRSYVARMRKGDPDDPLLRQILPIAAEELESAGFHNDPVGDLKAMPVPGVLHKYRGRVLLITTGACGIHCRYCFRRHFPYGDANPATDDWRPALDYITADSTISEVILIRWRCPTIASPGSRHSSALSPISSGCASTAVCPSCCRNASTPRSWHGWKPRPCKR